MKELITVSNQLFLFAFLYLVGILSVKLKILTQSALDSVAKFIVSITMPLMLFTTIINGPSIDEFKNITSIFIIYPLLLAVLYLVSNVIIKLMHIKDEHKNLFRATFIFGNTGFIGIPLILSLFPRTGIIYISGCMIIDQLLLWTVGMWLTKSVDAMNDKGFFKDIKNIINPSVVSILLAVICLICNFHMPELFNRSFAQVGNLTPALALIYIGGLFCYTDKKAMLKNIESYLIVLVKMLIMPAFLFFICNKFGCFSEQVKVTLILLSLPSMSTLVIFSKVNNSDSDYVLGNVTLTTIFSLITVPILTFLFN